MAEVRRKRGLILDTKENRELLVFGKYLHTQEMHK